MLIISKYHQANISKSWVKKQLKIINNHFDY
uniref:Uncharacterized protein n=1 Tax=Rhizophora mucronata TaxID=61149 RepID=A0A2P2NU45_RHIMU